VLCLLVQVGELCVAGPGLSSGYLRNPEATRAAFFLWERAGGADMSRAPADALEVDRFYRTGDLAQRLPDGNLVWVGRKDRQVGWLLSSLPARTTWGTVERRGAGKREVVFVERNRW
jgi:non-ribosomal peptide synthetase component F